MNCMAITVTFTTYFTSIDPTNIGEFSGAHQAIHAILEQEIVEDFDFLDVLIERRANRAVQLSVYRQPTWMSNRTQFLRFVSPRCK